MMLAGYVAMKEYYLAPFITEGLSTRGGTIPPPHFASKGEIFAWIAGLNLLSIIAVSFSFVSFCIVMHRFYLMFKG